MPDSNEYQGQGVTSDLSRLEAYDYFLPQELIAQKPSDQRDRSRLMVINRENDDISHRRFQELPAFLQEGDLLVANNAKVIPARLIGHKPTGGAVEIFLSQPLVDGDWEALVKMSGRIKPGVIIELDGAEAEVLENLEQGLCRIHFDCKESVLELAQRIGGIPLPPYIERDGVEDQREKDRIRYQTVYAAKVGAVAAPTAGLHFTEELIVELREDGIGFEEVTLHVGLGTFQPIRESELDKVQLHTERYELPQSTIDAIEKTRENGGRVVAVGTTTVRVLEGAAQTGCWHAHKGETNLFLRPGSRFDIVDGMITNFHLPKSSLIMLVAAFTGKPLVDAAYRTAVQLGYRFYSYGDAMLIL